MTDDPYQILGVPRTGKPDEIRKAYRKRAKELHPDLHPGDKEVEPNSRRFPQPTIC